MRRYLGHILAAAVLTAFVAAGAYSFSRMTAQYGLFMDYFRTGNWIATQANFEYLRLVEAISSYYADPSPEAREQILTRLDLFWSRLPLVLEGEEGLKIRGLTGAAEMIQRIIADLPALESKLQAIDGTSALDYRSAIAQVETYRAPLRDILQRLLTHDGETMSSTALIRQRDQMFIAFGLVGLAGTALFLMLTGSMRAAQRASDEARQAEARALLARQELEDAIESISEGFVLFDRDERLVIANSQYKEFYPAVTELATPGTSLTEILHNGGSSHLNVTPADRKAWVHSRLGAMRGPKGPYTVHLADGRTLRVSDRRTRSGGIVSVRADITDLIRAEDLLKNRLAAIEAAPDGIAIVDRFGLLQFVNRSLAALYGETPNTLVGFPWPSLFVLAERPALERRGTEVTGARQHWRGSALGARPDGTTFPVDIGLSATDDGGLVLALRNVEHEIAMQEQQTRLEHQSQQAQKMEAIGRLAGGIAHDFNNILAAIVGYAGFLADDLPRGSQLSAFAANIRTAADHAKRLVQQILAFSRSQDIERLPVDPRRMVAETAALLHPTLPPTTRVEVQNRLSDCLVWANATQINQVLMNLCVNANDALDGKVGHIELSIDGPLQAPAEFGSSTRGPATGRNAAPAESLEPAMLRSWAGGPPRHARYVRLSVADDGTGMSRPVMERMFDPFFTTKELGRGTGLGLAAVHGIVLSHGGLIEIESREGRGTTFHIYLPVHEEPGELAAHATQQDLPRGTERVLVVDDLALVGTMLSTTLERLGYDVTLCASAEDALEAIGENAFAWDVLLSDVRMPGISGIDLARFAREARPGFPVVLCSGFSDHDAEAQARALGLAPILSKPVDQVALARAIRQALDAEKIPANAA